MSVRSTHRLEGVDPSWLVSGFRGEKPRVIAMVLMLAASLYKSNVARKLDTVNHDVKTSMVQIGEIIDSEELTKVAVMGLGDLGRALVNYLHDKRSKLDIVAIFDVNPDKVGTDFNDVPCYSVEEIPKIIRGENISIGIITVPAKQAPVTAGRLIDAGIKGILNYTPTPIQVPDHVYLEEYDMITSLEKVAFYVKLADEKRKLNK